VAALRIGTRGSKLALWQAEHVALLLRTARPLDTFEIAVIRTAADKRPDVPLQSFGDKSLFIQEIEEALLAGRVDLAVHSLKDVPSRLDARFALAAILAREDARDVLLTRDGGPLPAGSRVGTSSLRRESQLRAAFPSLEFAPIRGNVDTRLRKLQDGEYDGIVLAAAGLHRLGIPVRDEAYLPVETCLPAPGQAALCVETLAGRTDLAACLDHEGSRLAVEAERAFAADLDAGCRVPVAAYAVTTKDSKPAPSDTASLSGRVSSSSDDEPRSRSDRPSARQRRPASGAPANGVAADVDAQKPSGSVWLRTVVAANDGSRLIRTDGSGDDPRELGQRVAREALAHGGGELLAASR
jgi:hydroxymethylbilane synthase